MFPKPSIGFGLALLAITQIPFALNESLKFVCISTTWADYAVFWDWGDIPIDSRVRYCLGGNNLQDEANMKISKKEDKTIVSP